VLQTECFLLISRFNHAPWERIKKQNILLWLAWSCFGKSLDETMGNPEWAAFLQETLSMLEARTGTVFEDGYDDKLELMRLTMDPVNVSYLAGFRGCLA
jgi:hypothetical protein